MASSHCNAVAQMVLIMDEVDGMSAGDRGGVADLIQTLKGAKLPIICICNDKYNQKLKSLRNHCLELDYRSALIPACSAEGQVAPCMPGSCVHGNILDGPSTTTQPILSIIQTSMGMDL